VDWEPNRAKRALALLDDLGERAPGPEVDADAGKADRSAPWLAPRRSGSPRISPFVSAAHSVVVAASRGTISANKSRRARNDTNR